MVTSMSMAASDMVGQPVRKKSSNLARKQLQSTSEEVGVKAAAASVEQDPGTMQR